MQRHLFAASDPKNQEPQSLAAPEPIVTPAVLNHAQYAAATEGLATARRELYRILAGDDDAPLT